MSIKKFIKNLKISIFFIVAIPVLVVAILFGLLKGDLTRQALKRFGEEMNGLNKASYEIYDFIDNQTRLLIQTGSDKTVTADNIEEAQVFVQNRLRESNVISQARYFDNKGKEIFNTPICPDLKLPPPVKYDPLWLDNAFQGKTSISRVLYYNKIPWINITVPVYSRDGTEIKGALSADISLEELFHHFNKVITNKRGIALVVDDKGVITYTAGRDPEGFTRFQAGKIVDISRKAGFNMVTIDRNQYLVSNIRVPEVRLNIIWIAPVNEFSPVINKMGLVATGGLLVLLGIAFLVNWFINNNVQKPLEQLTETSKSIAMDVFKEKEITVNLDDSSEIGNVANAFDKFKDRIKSYMEENKVLVTRTQENLERRQMDLQTIHSATEAFVSVKDFSQLSDYIVEKMQNVFSAVFCNLYVRSDEKKLLLAAQKCNEEVNCSDFALDEFPIAEDPFDEIKNSLRALIVHEASVEKSLGDRISESGIGAYCAFPMITGKNFIGVIEMGFPKGVDLSEDSISLLGTLVKAASIALENSRLYKKMMDEMHKIENLLSNMSDGVISMNQDNIIISFNKAAEQITGIPKEKAIGSYCYDIFKGLCRVNGDELTCCDTGCFLKQPQDPRQIPLINEHSIMTPIDGRKILEFSTTIENDEITGSVTFVSVIRDISKAKELERLRSDFIDTISHELRTPLTSIKGYVSTLLHPKAKFPPEEVKEFLSIINDESDKLNRMVTDLLEASQLQQSTLDIKPRPFDLNEFINEVVRVKSATSPIHKIEINLDSENSVYGDPYQMRFVMLHLIDNAIKYSPEGGTINISTSSACSDSITIMVEDEGIGIPIGQRDKVFNLFHRVDNRSTRRIYGVGLGLYIAKKIIEAHGSKIWVESSLKGGANFVFTLPRYVDNEKTVILDLDCIQQQMLEKENSYNAG